jgi:hypothetical protein
MYGDDGPSLNPRGALNLLLDLRVIIYATAISLNILRRWAIQRHLDLGGASLAVIVVYSWYEASAPVTTTKRDCDVDDSANISSSWSLIPLLSAGTEPG